MHPPGVEADGNRRVLVPHAHPEPAGHRGPDVQRVRAAGVQMGVGQQLRGEQLGGGGEFAEFVGGQYGPQGGAGDPR